MRKNCIAIALLALMLTGSQAAATAPETPQNIIVLIDQNDRNIEIQTTQGNKPVRRKSGTTGLEYKGDYAPVLVEFHNENGAVGPSALKGVAEADVLYEYPTKINGTMALAGLYSDHMPDKVGPIGDATITGTLIREEWNAGYVFHSVPQDEYRRLTLVGQGIEYAIEKHSLNAKPMMFPAEVAPSKAWKRYLAKDPEIISGFNFFASLPGISKLASSISKAEPRPYLFMKDKDTVDSEILVSGIEVNNGSRTFQSVYMYDKEKNQYARFVDGQPFIDAITGEQLTFSNVIVQRASGTADNGEVGMNPIGKGNADIFLDGKYIAGYWSRPDAASATMFYTDTGKQLKLRQGHTMIIIQTPSAPVALLNE